MPWLGWLWTGANATTTSGSTMSKPISRRRGYPSGFCGPLMAMYQAPRHIKIDGAMGKTHHPLRCIPPGCLAAVDVLAMITFPWVKQSRLVMGNCSARA